MAGAAKVRDVRAVLERLQKKYVRGLNKPTQEALAAYQYEGDTLNRYLRLKHAGSREAMEDMVDFMEMTYGIDDTLGEPSYWNYGGTEARKVERQGMDMVKRIDEAIRKAPRFDEPLTVHRRVGHGTRMGQDFRNPGFTSTSARLESAAEAGVPGGGWGQKTALTEIEIPPNKPLLSLDLNPMQGEMSEMEVLLPRNLRLQRIGQRRFPADLQWMMRDEFPLSKKKERDRFVQLIKKYKVKRRGGLVHGYT